MRFQFSSLSFGILSFITLWDSEFRYTYFGHTQYTIQSPPSLYTSILDRSHSKSPTWQFLNFIANLFQITSLPGEQVENAALEKHVDFYLRTISLNELS